MLFRSRFEALRAELGGLIREIRILGTMIGLDLAIDATDIVGRCLERRLLINATHGHVVRLGGGGLVEVQGTGEGGTFSRGQLDRLLDLAESGIDQLKRLQRDCLGEDWPLAG